MQRRKAGIEGERANNSKLVGGLADDKVAAAAVGKCANAATCYAITCEYECYQSGNIVGVRMRVVAANQSSRACSACDLNTLTLKHCTEFSA